MAQKRQEKSIFSQYRPNSSQHTSVSRKSLSLSWLPQPFDRPVAAVDTDRRAPPEEAWPAELATVQPPLASPALFDSEQRRLLRISIVENACGSYIPQGIDVGIDIGKARAQ
jgi:hypothetical protein